MRLPPAIIVHGLDQARAALAPGLPVTLLSAPGAAAYAGVGWWQAIVRTARADHPATPCFDILDCGDAPGRALEALRAQQNRIVLRAARPVWNDVAHRAASLGIELLAEAPPALDLQALDQRAVQRSDARALTRISAWLSDSRAVTQPAGSVKPHRKSSGAPPNMSMTVQKILANYESDNPGSKAQLYRILMQGKLRGTGKVVILPVDQGFEHGPARSFAPNPAAYDPHYHFKLAIEAGLNAYAAPLGMLEAGADTYAGRIPLILKLNSSNSLATEKDQAVTGSVSDALRLGCSAIGFTIYPGSEYAFKQMNELRELAEEAKSAGLAVVVWSYPRGPALDKAGETALDICAYAAHMAALLGAHIIKVKPPTAHLSLPAAVKVYEEQNIPRETMVQRVKHVVQCCFDGRRIVVFSGGENNKDEAALLRDIQGIRDGGANGAIIGRNTFQRPRDEALALLAKIIDIYAKPASE